MRPPLHPVSHFHNSRRRFFLLRPFRQYPGYHFAPSNLHTAHHRRSLPAVTVQLHFNESPPWDAFNYYWPHVQHRNLRKMDKETRLEHAVDISFFGYERECRSSPPIIKLCYSIYFAREGFIGTIQSRSVINGNFSPTFQQSIV